MKISKQAAVLVYIFLIAGGAAAYIHFSAKGSVDVFSSDVRVSPESFSIDVAKGSHYVRSLKILNSGEGKEIYFETVVEGPDPESIDVSYHLPSGERITASNKLSLPAATQNAAEVVVNVHIDVDESAAEGSYTIYILAKET